MRRKTVNHYSLDIIQILFHIDAVHVDRQFAAGQHLLFLRVADVDTTQVNLAANVHPQDVVQVAFHLNISI